MNILFQIIEHSQIMHCFMLFLDMFNLEEIILINLYIKANEKYTTFLMI